MLVAAFVTCGAGCFPDTTTFESRVSTAHTAPVTRLVVVDAVQSPYFYGALHTGFVDGLSQRLAACGIASRITHIDDLDADPMRSVTVTVKDFGADAVMMIKADGGHLQINGGDHQYELRFQLEVRDVVSGERFWRAESRFDRLQNIFSNETDSGIGFATRIAERLRDDRVLPGCPPSSQWPKTVVSR